MSVTPNEIENAYGSYSDGAYDEREMRREIEEKFNIPEGELDRFLLLHRENARRYDAYTKLRDEFETETGTSWDQL